MNFIKRAFLNIKEKKGRSILLLLVMSAILLFVLSGIIIQNAAKSAIATAKESSNATVTLTANREQAFKNIRKSKSKSTTLSLPSVSIATAKKIAKSSYVKSYNVTNSTTVNAKSFTAIKTSSSSQSGPSMGGNNKSQSSSGDITLSGVSSTSTVLSSSSAKLVSGRGLTVSDANTNNVVIEKELAKDNSLKVGSTIKVKDTDDKVRTLKVVGIYKASSTASSGGMGQSDPGNTIYTSAQYVNKVKGTTGKAESVTFIMNNPAKASAFIKQAKKLISTSKFSLTTDDSTYQSLLTPLNNVKSFANKIVWLVTIAGTIILALIVILMIRERRYEIGVLLSMGEKRWKVISQFFTEMFVVLIFSTIIAVIGGGFVGNYMSKELVSQSSSTTTSTMTVSSGQSQGGAPTQGGMPNGGGATQQGQNTGSQQSSLSNLEVSVDLMSILELFGFGLVIILIAILAGTVNVLRLEPKKILIL
ncbi:ABC transporter permease [Liquorilactobacillus hordei]|uniref:ABC superfamily ATP binding cassette transporter, membrane protein n=1 Tax=Liquorilactobacillus hordei DSM 19519 TaxID=1423759 RepID=A0A0R1MG79_9LACO|nr:ABC transporter permease [Liquorilactobacillus hordei]KRL06950.1 ABC superfamily ATP binding cassette transporter, membrane protein [Liquorilactobacillus hordei DSM 19519]QYH51689.1 ABC transporter permease [Liquorilactobacillus hordei DSM 19519]